MLPAGSAPSGDLGWRRRVAGLKVRMLSLESLSYDLLAQAESGSDPGAMASVLKLVGSELMQDISGAMIDVLGRRGLIWSAEVLEGLAERGDALVEGGSGAISEYLHGRAATIYGGSSEIQRNIISKAVLGL